MKLPLASLRIDQGESPAGRKRPSSGCGTGRATGGEVGRGRWLALPGFTLPECYQFQLQEGPGGSGLPGSEFTDMEQPVTRRTFFQFSLALACASQAEAFPAPSLRGLFEPRLQGGRLMVALRIHNDGEKPSEILARRGVANAIQMHASWGSWQAQSTPETDTEMRTRAGPRLVWQPLPPQATWDAGTFEFALPSGSKELLEQPAAFRANVQTHQGALVLQAQGIRVAAAP